MESQISPKNIETRVEALASASQEKPVETAAPVVEAPKVEAPKVEAPKVEPAKVEAPKVETSKVEAPKVEAPVEPTKEKKAPNDPSELRKWSTKLSQENAALREDMKTIKAALDKLTKKPVDYAELAKNPEGLKAHIEAERQEAMKELQEKYTEANSRAVANETRLVRIEMEKDTENYPRFAKLFPHIQTLARNGDGRVNWNQRPELALAEAYALADQLSPAEVVAAPAAIVPDPVPVEKGMTKAEVDVLVAKAKEDARKEIEEGLRNERNGAGLGSKGKGGSRDTRVSSDALWKMPKGDLKALIEPK